ncbi:MAG: hypothetical protein EBZ47_06565 [Chlamydiae bacterium]|nr:hypothetical protein [Chlamydiota bacterium]
MFLLSKKFTPILFDFLTKPLSFTALKKDLISSITLAMLSIPLFVELGIAFGGTPEQGLITGIISGIVLAFLTGSNVQMCGPSATIILIVKNILTSHGFESLVICMIFGSVFLILFGMLKIAYWIKFIPFSKWKNDCWLYSQF